MRAAADAAALAHSLSLDLVAYDDRAHPLGEIHAFEIFAFVARIFFCISFPLMRLAAYLEKRMV